MEPEFLGTMLQDNPLHQSSNSTSTLLNEDGLNLIRETIEAVKNAINKVNYLKHYLQLQSNNYNSVGVKTDENISSLPVSSPNLITPRFIDYDFKKQIFFSILDNRITETEITDVLEKEGFQDFVVTLKKKLFHSYGFIKFSSEDSVTRAIELNLKILINGQLMKIKPYKTLDVSSNVSLNSTKDACIFQERDKGLLNYVTPVYQNNTASTQNYVSPKGSVEKIEEKVVIANNNPFVFSSKAEIMVNNKILDTELIRKENNDSIYSQSVFNSNHSVSILDYDQNLHNKPLTSNANYSSRKKFPFKNCNKKNSKKMRKKLQQNFNVNKNKNNQKTEKKIIKKGQYFGPKRNFHQQKGEVNVNI